MNNNLKIFSGRSNPTLAKKIVESLGIGLGQLTIKNFADGELWIKFEENIRGTDVFIIQSTNSPAENIMELVLIIDAAVRASANTVTAVIPYFGYGRQDRKDNPRVLIVLSQWIYILRKSKVLQLYHLIIYIVGWFCRMQSIA